MSPALYAVSNVLSAAELADLVEFTEARAFADMFRAAPASLDMYVEESDECVAFFAPSLDVLLFNRVIGLGVRVHAAKSNVHSLAKQYRASGVKNHGIQLSPEAEPGSLRDWIAESDLQRRDSWTKVYRDAEPLDLIPTDLRVEQIGHAQADVFGETACAGFGMPPELKSMMSGCVGKHGWLHYVAWDHVTPAAVAALYVNDGVGWLGVATTLPQFQRRGAQGALMSRRILDGIDLGCHWFVTETGEDTPENPNPSFHNMMRTGFKVAYDRPNFMPAGISSE